MTDSLRAEAHHFRHSIMKVFSSGENCRTRSQWRHNLHKGRYSLNVAVVGAPTYGAE